MNLDVFTISALVDEFLDTFVGGRVQDAIDVDAFSIGLEIYANGQRHYLYMDADQNQPRVHLTGDRLRRGLQRPKQIGLLFRRYVEGGIITHVSQPDWERILQIDVEGKEGNVEIIIEPMQRRANVLLVKDGIILDCMRRVGPEDNRYRLSLPAHEYVPPPPQTGKRNPFTIALEDIVGFFEQVQDPKRKTFQVLSGHLLGFSPLLAREVVFRSEGDVKQKAQDADSKGLFDVLQTILPPLKQRNWQFGIVKDEDDIVEAYSVYPIEHRGTWQSVDSMRDAMLAYYGAPIGEDAYNTAKKPVQKAIEEAIAKSQAKLASLERSMTDDSEREHLRQSGELILAYQYTLEENQTALKAQYDPSGPELVINLDPTLTPLDNAQRYFSKYNKAKRALDDVPRLIEETQAELALLDQLEMDLEMASNWPDIDVVQQMLQQKGYWQGKRVKRMGGEQSAPIRLVTPDGFVIWIGRNSRQNEIVTFKKAGRDDFWLHARDVPGAHVIIKNDGRPIPDDVIDEAASIAAYYSKRRSDGKVPVDITRCKYVKKIKGAGQGMVTYRNERTLTVTPMSEKSFEQA